MRTNATTRKTRALSMLLTAVIVAVAPMPAPAQEPTPELRGPYPEAKSETVKTIPQTSAPEADDSELHELKFSFSQAASHLVFFPLGFALGTPAAILRDTGKVLKMGTGDLTHESKSRLLTVPTAIVYSPLAFVAGFLRGPVLAGIHAGTDKPFSKESFCLGRNLEYLGDDSLAERAPE